MDKKEKINIFFMILTRIDNNISIADTKANTSLTFLFVILTLFVGITGAYINHINFLGKECISKSEVGVFIVWLINIVIFIGWYFACTKVLTPNLKKTIKEHDDYQSIIFFKSIKELTPHEFLTYTKTINEDTLLNDLSTQIHTVSEIVSKKYKIMRKVNYWTSVSIIFFLLFLFLCLVVQ